MIELWIASPAAVLYFSQFSDQADYDGFDFAVIGENRLVIVVCRLKSCLVPIFVKPLEGSIFIVEDGDDQLAVFGDGCAAAYNVIAIADSGVNHAVAFNLQSEQAIRFTEARLKR